MKQSIVVVVFALFFVFVFAWRGLISPLTVPGVGGGAGEVGGVGLPESTGGQGRIDWLALPATAQQRGGENGNSWRL